MNKPLSLTLACALIAFGLRAQTPQGINYQAVARDAGGAILASQNISLRVTLQDGNAGATLYQERHDVPTNAYGLFNVTIGAGTVLSGTFATIDWGNVTPWMQVEMDPNGGSSYVLMGSQQLMSVPYALYAAQSGGGGGPWNTNGANISNSNTGNVGVGTSTPQSKLDVAGNIALNANALHLLDGSNTDHVLRYDPLVNGPYLSGYDGGALGTAGLPHSLTWDYNGNVGVRSTLSVDGANANNGTFGHVLQLGGSSSSEGIGSNRSGSGINPAGVDFYTDAVNRMLITHDGKVGIGTTTPAAALDVSGTFKLADGTQGAGKVLTSDASGNASWQAPPSTQVSFKAQLLSGDMNFNAYAWLICDSVMFNNGEGYNHTTGEFHAPSPGLYFFHAEVMVYSSNKPHTYAVELYMPQHVWEQPATVMEESATIGDFPALNVSNLIYLNAGDLVQVRVWEEAAGDAWIRSYVGRTFFCGYKVN